MKIQNHNFTQQMPRMSDAGIWGTVILRTLGLAVVIGMFAVSSRAAADEFIHFDCVNNSTPATDPLGVNDLQCVPRKDSVLGPATVHPEARRPDPSRSRHHPDRDRS